MWWTSSSHARSEPEPTGGARFHEPRIVAVGLGAQEEWSTELRGQLVDEHGELLEQRECPAVVQLVHGVEAETVAVEVGQPGAGAVDQEGADLVGAGAVEVHGLAPRRAVAVGEVGAEARQVVPAGSEVVVHHVEDHAEAEPVAGIDEGLAAVGTAIGLVHGEEVDAVVAPTPRAVEACDRGAAPRG